MKRPSAAGGELPLIEWCAAGRALNDGPVSGDLHVAEYFPGGALVAVIDGLGHGPEAAVAAQAAAVALRQQPDETLTVLMTLCHQALRRTRGAVISLASFNAATATVSWLGVGNVAGLFVRRSPGTLAAREGLVARGGVVGYRLPALREAKMPVLRGDLLVMATDGIGSDFNPDVTPDRPVEDIARRILRVHARSNDDALVLAVLYRGVPP